MIDHNRFLMLAATVLDEALVPADAAAFEAHLEACRTCRDEARALRRDQFRLGHLGTVAPLPQTRVAVMMAARRGERPRSWVLLAAAAMLVATLLTTILVAGAILRNQNRFELTETWQAVPADVVTAGESSSRIRAVTSTNRGFFAAGSAGGKAAVWYSEDGGPWTVMTDLPGGDGAELTAIEVGGSGLIAVGRSGGATAIWFSPDGHQWLAAESDASLAEVSIRALVQGRQGWLAIGARASPDGAVGAVLTSPDGRTWSLEPATVESDTGAVKRLPALQAAVALSDGDWLVVPTFDSACCAPMVSANGTTWTIAGGDLARSAGFDGLARVDAAVVGFDATAGAAQWSDGGAWTTATMPAGTSARFESLTVVGRTFVLLGSAGGRPVILRSDDGRAWTADTLLADGASVTAYDLAGFGGIEVAVGIRDGASAIWARRR